MKNTFFNQKGKNHRYIYFIIVGLLLGSFFGSLIHNTVGADSILISDSILIDSLDDYSKLGFDITKIDSPVVYEKECLVEGHMPIVIKFNNVASFSISENSNLLSSVETSKSGFKSIDYSYKILQSYVYSWIEPIYKTIVICNDVKDKNTSNISKVCYDDNIIVGNKSFNEVRYRWIETKTLSSLSVEKSGFIVVDVIGKFKAELGDRQIDIIPKLSINGVKSTLNKFAWWSSSWNYRKLITIDNTKILGTAWNFPLYFNLTSIDFKNNVSQSDGGDFAFINASNNTTQYYHEIVDFQKTTGALDCWINMSFISTTCNKFYIYYGNPSCANQWDIEKTWNKSYVLVQHFNETTKPDDSTYLNNDVVTVYNSPNYHQGGKCGYSIKLDSASKDYFLTSNSASINFSKTSTYTISAWYKTSDTNDAQWLVSKRYGAGGAYAGYFLGLQDSAGAFHSVGMRDSTPTFRRVESGALNYNTWNYVTVSAVGTAIILYNNITQMGISSTALAGTINNNRGMTFGRYCQDLDGQYLNGFIDEVHISNVVRSPSYIRMQFYNQNNTAVFYNIAVQESLAFYDISFLNENPTNGSSNNLLIGTWCIDIVSTGEAFNYTIELNTGLNVSENNVHNGTKCLSYNLNCGTNYTVWVNASNVFTSNASKFWFITTECVYCTYQTYNYTNLSLYWWIDLTSDNGTFNWSIECSNGQNVSGIWDSNGTYGIFLYNLSYNTTYTIWVNCSTHLCGTNESYLLNTGWNINEGDFVMIEGFSIDADLLFLGILLSLWVYFVSKYFEYREFVFSEIQFGLSMPLTLCLAVFSFNYPLGFILVMLLPVFAIWILIDGILYRKKGKR